MKDKQIPDWLNYKRAAGLEIRSGRPSKGKKLSKEDLQRLCVDEEKSIREAAEVLGCSKDMIYRGLKEHGLR